MDFVLATLLIVVLLAAWMLTWFGLPGNWLMVIVSAVYVALVPVESSVALGWGMVVALLAVAVLGELVELLAGVLGAAKAGGSRRGALLALAGSLIGGIVGLFMGLPVPLVGPVVAAVLFASVGALVGAVLGERWEGRNRSESWRIGKAAFWGRLFGTLAKAGVGAVMIGATILALLW